MANRRTPVTAESSGKSKETFEFVSVVPTKDGRAKPNRQAVVRKNAARYQWRNNKSSKALVQKEALATVSGKDGPVVEKDEEEPEENEVTGSESYGLHGSRRALQTYYLSFAQDEKIAKIMTFSEMSTSAVPWKGSLTISLQVVK
jgi:hypothetical protein